MNKKTKTKGEVELKEQFEICKNNNKWVFPPSQGNKSNNLVVYMLQKHYGSQQHIISHVAAQDWKARPSSTISWTSPAEPHEYRNWKRSGTGFCRSN
jgi:hypothetical protein